MVAVGALRLTGRVIAKDGQNYTVQSSSTYGAIHVWNPTKQELTLFDSIETFENWAYGKPVSTVGNPVK